VAALVDSPKNYRRLPVSVMDENAVKESLHGICLPVGMQDVFKGHALVFFRPASGF
jgi:hypothetical protein